MFYRKILLSYFKVQTSWEGDKIWKKSTFFLNYLINVKTKWEMFFQIFVAFLEYPNFIIWN